MSANNDNAASEAWYEHRKTWTCAPVWPPQRFFAIFTMARSASSTACSVISTLEDATCAHEPLNPVLVHPGKKKLLRSDPVGYLKDLFVATFSHLGAAPCTWGFKLFAQHASNSTLHDWLWDHLDVAIVLERRDRALPQATACVIQYPIRSPVHLGPALHGQCYWRWLPLDSHPRSIAGVAIEWVCGYWGSYSG